MSGTVLIVDDSLTVRMDLMELLERGRLADQCRARRSPRRGRRWPRTRFSLVVLDVLLPDGDGIELLEEIRATPSATDTAVMLLSTEAEVHDRVRGLTTGADEYVGKPYDRELRGRAGPRAGARAATAAPVRPQDGAARSTTA